MIKKACIQHGINSMLRTSDCFVLIDLLNYISVSDIMNILVCTREIQIITLYGNYK